MRFFKSAFVALSLMGSLVSGVALEKRKEKSSTKYFHEPGRSDLTGHYDIRYFKDVVDYDVRLDTLRHMVRAWLQTTNAEGIETWIAHGTLLGWWWNGKMLPWDWDLDVQVMDSTLVKLSDPKYNNTIWPYVSDDGFVKRTYFLDINPNSIERVRGDGNNVIDARWVDMRNGLYIDITGISETNPKEKPNMYHCKNLHYYHINDIYPLRDTYFEGVPAKIPYSYDDILIKEYGVKAFTVTNFEGHRWNPQTKEWVLTGQVPADRQNEADSYKSAQEMPDFIKESNGQGLFSNVWRLVHWW